MENQNIQRNLVRGLVVYEAFVISAVAYSGISVATSGGSPIYAAIPILAVAASEGLRVPLSAWATRLSFGNRLLAIFVLLCLAVASAEGLALAFDNLLAARVLAVTNAGRNVDEKASAVSAMDEKISPIKSALASSEKEITSLDAKHSALISAPPTPPGFSGTTCRRKNGSTGGCPADASAQKTYAASRSDYSRQLSEIEAQRAKASSDIQGLRNKLASFDTVTPMAALATAKRDYAVVLEASPMHRIAASWFGVKPSEISEAQFSTARKWAVTGLSVSLATMSALVGWLAFQTPKTGPSKIERSLRALIARHRKRTIVERPVEVIVERIKEVPIRQTVIRYLPIDGTGRHKQLTEREISASGINPIVSKLIEDGRHDY